MKQLILIRHGDAPKALSMLDIDRELSELGKKQSKKSAEHLERYSIGHVLCSPVPRTKQTFEIIQNNLRLDDNIIDYPEPIYENDYDTLVRLVHIQNNEEDTMLIVGHNPSLLQLALYYDNDHDDRWNDYIMSGLKPAQIIVVNFPDAEDWGQTCHAGGKIIDIFVPNAS